MPSSEADRSKWHRPAPAIADLTRERPLVRTQPRPSGRLLPQPHGFEGLGPVLKELKPGSLPVAQGPHVWRPANGLGTATATPNAGSNHQDDVRSLEESLLDFERHLLDSFVAALPELLGLLAAEVDTAVGPNRAGPVVLGIGSRVVR